MADRIDEKACDFLWELRFHNEKAWFEENRARFDKVLRLPFAALAKETAALLEKRFPARLWLLHISRIYRDARHPSPNGPYRDHLWFSLKEEADLSNEPMLWFEVSPEGCSVGMGFWTVTPAQLAAYRKRIDSSPHELTALVQDAAARGFVFDSPQYARKKGERGELLDPWYNAKRPGVSKPVALADCTAGQIEQELAALVPLYAYLREACCPAHPAPSGKNAF